MGKRGVVNKLGIAFTAVVVVLALFVTGLWLFRKTFLVTRESTDIVLRFDRTKPKAQIIFFPPGSNPKLISYSIKNVGPEPIRAPYLVVNDDQPFYSEQAIIDKCKANHRTEEAVILCLFELISTKLKHVSLADVDNQSDNFPEDVLLALNYYGFSQCGPSSDYLAQLTHYMGYDACTIGFGNHVMPEVLVNHRWILLDPDRGLFYPSMDHTHLLSYGDLHNGTATHKVPGRFGLSGSTGSMYKNQDSIKNGAIGRYCNDKYKQHFPLMDYHLNPRSSLEFFSKFDRKIIGCRVILHTSIVDAKTTIPSPYPILALTLFPDQDQPVTGQITTPKTGKFNTQNDPLRIALSTGSESYSQLFQTSVEVNSPLPIEADLEMRFGKSAFPELHEGANEIYFVWAPPRKNEILGDIAEVTLNVDRTRLR